MSTPENNSRVRHRHGSATAGCGTAGTVQPVDTVPDTANVNDNSTHLTCDGADNDLLSADNHSRVVDVKLPKKLTKTSLSSTNSSPARDEATRKKKVEAVYVALERRPPDVLSLKQLSISRGGLLTDSLRRTAWPCQLDVDTQNIAPKPDAEVLQSHVDYNQVVLDVNRSLRRFPPGMDEKVRLGMQDQLVAVIMRVLVTHPELHYYQGFHDVCVTFLLVVGEDLTFALMDKLAVNHFRDFMDQNMDRTNHMLNYLYPIVARANPRLERFMHKSEVGTIFALSWLITWYGHVLNDLKHIVRLYDFFIACHPLMPIYLAAAIVLHREEDILKCECEMCMVHSLLSRIPQDLPLEQLICYAGDLFVQYPPPALEADAKRHYERAKERLRETHVQRPGGRSQRHLAVGGGDSGALVRLTIWSLTAAFSAALFAVLRTSPWDWFWRR